MWTNGWGKIDEILTFVLEKVVDTSLICLLTGNYLFLLEKDIGFTWKVSYQYLKPLKFLHFSFPKLTPDHHYMLPPCLVLDSRLSPKDSMSKCSFQAGEGYLHPDLSGLRLSFIMDSKIIFSLVSYLFILGYFLYIKNSSSPLCSIYIANFHRRILNLLYLPTWPTPLDN